MQFSDLPQWIDMGPDEDFATPAADLAGLLKKRMGKKSQGGVGGDLGGVIGDDGMALGASAARPEGMKSL